jgi:hypothetical protein
VNFTSEMIFLFSPNKNVGSADRDSHSV